MSKENLEYNESEISTVIPNKPIFIQSNPEICRLGLNHGENEQGENHSNYTYFRYPFFDSPLEPQNYIRFDSQDHQKNLASGQNKNGVNGHKILYKIFSNGDKIESYPIRIQNHRRKK